MGNCLAFAGPFSGVSAVDFSSANLFNLGPKKAVGYEPGMETVEPELDDCEFPPIVSKELATLAMELGEFYVEKLAIISGGTSFATYTLGTPVTTVTEAITLNGIRPVRLANKSYSVSAPVVASTVVVVSTDETPVTYVKDTDYTVNQDILGFTSITRITGGAITDKDTVSVTYGYTPAIIRTLSRGGSSEVTPIVLRILHVKRLEGTKIYGFMIDIFKAYYTKLSKVSFGADKEAKDILTLPYEFTGKYDKSRSLGYQVDAINTLHGVTLADLNMDKMSDLDLAVLKDAAVVA